MDGIHRACASSAGEARLILYRFVLGGREKARGKNPTIAPGCWGIVVPTMKTEKRVAAVEAGAEEMETCKADIPRAVKRVRDAGSAAEFTAVAALWVNETLPMFTRARDLIEFWSSVSAKTQKGLLTDPDTAGRRALTDALQALGRSSNELLTRVMAAGPWFIDEHARRAFGGQATDERTVRPQC
jgi:hypothetical protein